MRATGPRKMETYRVKICDSEEAGKYYRRSRKRASDFMQRRYESFAEGVERIIRGKMLRKSKRSMRRKSLLKISNEGESRKLKNRVGLKFPGNFSALFLKNIGKST